MEVCGTGFSLWGLVLARAKTHRLKPVPLVLSSHIVTAFYEYVDVLQVASGKSGSGEPFYNSDVPLGGAIDHAARGLVRWALKRGRSFLHALELDDHGSHILPRFVRLRGHPAAKESAAAALDGGARQFRVFGNRVRVRDRSVETNPISFGHGFLLVGIVHCVAVH
jgi:hypothetical protein